MVQSASTSTLGDRVAHLLGSASAMARRAHPLLVIGVAAGFGYLATPLLLGPVSALSDAIHGGTTEIPRSDRLVTGRDGSGAAPYVPAPSPAPAVMAPGSSTSSTGAAWAGWLPPRPSAPVPKVVARVRPDYAPNPQQPRWAQRQARAAWAPVYHQGGRPFFGPNRNTFNRPCCIRRFDGGFNRAGGMGRIFGGGFRGGGWRR